MLKKYKSCFYALVMLEEIMMDILLAKDNETGIIQLFLYAYTVYTLKKICFYLLLFI